MLSLKYFTVLCSILWKSLKQTIFSCIFILCCYWFWLACVLLLALPFPWKPAVSVPLSVRTHALISVSDLCGLYYHMAKLLRTRSYLEWAGFEAKLWQSFLRVTVQLGRGILWLVFWLPRRFCLLVCFDCTIGLRGPCVVAVVSSELPRSDCLECKTWNKRVSTCVSMFLSRPLRMERMRCPAGMRSRHSLISDFSFPLGMAAMLGPGLQQEGDLTSLLPLILPPEKLLGNCHNFTAPCMLGSLGKCSSFKYSDSLSKENHLQGYLTGAKGQGTMCRETWSLPWLFWARWLVPQSCHVSHMGGGQEEGCS